MFCRHCGQQLDNQAVICVRCGRTPQNGVYYCWYCGAQSNPIAQVCTNCGVSLQAQNPIQSQAGNRSRLVAGLLGIFLGGFGIHNFYLGYTSKAVIQLIMGLIGFFSSFLFLGIGYGYMDFGDHGDFLCGFPAFGDLLKGY